MKRPTGLEDYYIIKNNQKLRFGYTTGSCSAAATKWAASLLLGLIKKNDDENYIELMTPKGILLCLPVIDVTQGDNFVSCAIIKDGGDDPDMTHGLKIYARVEKTMEKGVFLDGGRGVGRVTKKGLEQQVGQAAINLVPRQMIIEQAMEAIELSGYGGGLRVTIEVPDGEEIAKKTFNPRLGIQGGISILGTSGIVEPMSEKALIKTIETELKQQLAIGRKHLLVTLGNYGKAFLSDLDMLPIKESIKCSNYIGELVDLAVNEGAESILFVAHLGKFVKVAGGIMNTHSRNADCRGEILCGAALRCGASQSLGLRLLDINTTDEAIDLLKEEDILDAVIENIIGKMTYYLSKRAYGKIPIEVIVFSNEHGYLGQSLGAEALIKLEIEQEERLRGELK